MNERGRETGVAAESDAPTERTGADEGRGTAIDPAPDPTADRPSPSGRIPAAALSDRNALARAKGLPGLVIEGGEDAASEARRRDERRYLRLLIVMVAVIVLAGFVLGVAGLVVGGPAAS